MAQRDRPQKTTEHGECPLRAENLRLNTHTQISKHLPLLRGTKRYANSHQYYDTRG